MNTSFPLIIQQVAERYRAMGAAVSLNPQQDDLPSALRGMDYSPDLLVTFPDRQLLVEIASRHTLGLRPQLREVARLLAAESGWEFEIIFVDDWQEEAARMDSWDPATIRSHLEDAERLMDSLHNPNPVILILWALWEAAARHALKLEGVSVRGPGPATLLSQTFEQGIVGRQEYVFLSDALVQRNALAHGYTREESSPDSVRRLTAIIRQLLDKAEAPVAV